MLAQRVAMTGGGGFLGLHTRAALREHGEDARLIGVGDGFDADSARVAIEECDRLVHLAGVNRGSDDEVREDNVRFAEQIAGALRAAGQRPAVVVYANSTQSGNGTEYGSAKQRAGETLAAAADEVGARFLELQLPNLFGEHGRPFYNSVTATFSHLLAERGEPTVAVDRELTLLHAQDAAELILGHVHPADQHLRETRETVCGLLGRLTSMATQYRSGEVPDIATRFERDLFNTYRSYTFPGSAPIALQQHEDARGTFFEVARSRGGTGQTSFSTTAPGVTRGEHYHRRKIERFTVVAGQGRIRLRKLFADAVVEFDVRGDEPVAIDMPTMWAHSITNTGYEPLHTILWTNDLFDDARPDTIPEVV